MLNKKYLQVLRAQVLGYAVKRREVIKIAGDAQHHAKRAIFAFQRDDKKAGEESLYLANSLLMELNNKFKGDKALKGHI
jgi:predicted translin family RNA/ssDNA-binding protein